MRNLIWKFVTISALACGLAACGSDNTPAPPAAGPPPAAAPKLEDGFGANFGIAYRADPNGIANDPLAADIAPLDLTKEATTI